MIPISISGKAERREHVIVRRHENNPPTPEKLRISITNKFSGTDVYKMHTWRNPGPHCKWGKLYTASKIQKLAIPKSNFLKMDANGISAKAKYDCLLFDMDDTLYPLSSGLNLACRKNIEEFMLHHLNIDENIVPRMCLDLYREYGTTMAGLKALGYEFDNDEFHTYVHGRLPYEALKPDPVLRNLLLSMPQRKIIFTNADKAHVAKVLKRLGLEDCFEGVICFETLNDTPSLLPLRELDDGTEINDGDDYNNCISTPKSPILCKPLVEAIKAAIHIANIDPDKTIFFDDSTRNIASGKVAGLHTVIVGSSKLVLGADHTLSSIHNIKEALPEIWAGEQDADKLEQVIQATAVETVVLA